MYITDDIGNRYDHYSKGGAATIDFVLANGASENGWFLFPPAHPRASYLIFHDDDNGIHTPQIVRQWP
jgi:hypothetical protein